MPKSFTDQLTSRAAGQGWANVGPYSKHHEELREKDQWLYDSLLGLAGDDKQFTYDEYEGIYTNPDLRANSPYGRFAYNVGDTARALARIGSQHGIKLDQEILDRENLSYDGDDILMQVSGGGGGGHHRGPDYGKKDDWNVSWEYSVPGDGEVDDGYNVFRWARNWDDDPVVEEVEPVVEEEPVVEDCPEGQTRGVSGACIEDEEFAENPWEEPKKTPKALADKRSDWDANWDPNRYVDDASELGSIDYWTPTMTNVKTSSNTYKPSITEGKFSRYVTGDTYDHSKKQIESVLRAAGYKDNDKKNYGTSYADTEKDYGLYYR